MKSKANSLFDLRNPLRVKFLHQHIDYMAKLAKENPKMKAVYAFEVYKEQRSNAQNAYYHQMIDWLAREHHGITPDALKKELAEKYLPQFHHDQVTGKTVVIGGSTSALSTEQFTMLIEQIWVDYAVEYGIMIPRPGELEARMRETQPVTNL